MTSIMTIGHQCGITHPPRKCSVPSGSRMSMLLRCLTCAIGADRGSCPATSCRTYDTMQEQSNLVIFEWLRCMVMTDSVSWYSGLQTSTV